MTSIYDNIECLICPPKADETPVTHKWASERRRRHIVVSNILREGLLERSWWLLTKTERLAVVAYIERLGRQGGAKLDWVRDLIEQDGPARNAGKDYAMTTRTKAQS